MRELLKKKNKQKVKLKLNLKIKNPNKRNKILIFNKMSIKMIQNKNK